MDWSYLAGYIDADGTIHIARPGRGYAVTIKITSIDPRILRQIQTFLSGRGKVATYTKTSAGNRIWQFSVFGKPCRWILQNIIPYLISKKPQAQLCLDMPRAFKGTNRYSEKAFYNVKIKEEQECFYQACRELNKNSFSDSDFNEEGIIINLSKVRNNKKQLGLFKIYNA